MRALNRLLTPVLSCLVLAAGGFGSASASEPSTPGAISAVGPDGTVVEMPLRHTKVSIEVTAFVERATIEQVFSNPFTDPIEAVYTFPLGDRAAVDEFELQVGDRTIRGEIKRREDARAVYEQARASGFQAALLEQQRPNVFTQSVANLEPGKPITVRLRTIETLRYERGIYRLTFPLVVGPRYIPPGGLSPSTACLLSPTLPPGTRSGHDVEIDVTIAAGVRIAKIESPSHKTVINQTSVSSAAVRLADGDAIPNKDFLLQWSVGSEKPALGLLAYRDGGDGYFTLLLQPKGDVAPSEAAPKEITFVVDTSGSMNGVPLEASKRLAARALHALGPRDTFNVIRFSGDNEVFSEAPLPNDPAAVEAAINWLNRRQGGGGTEMLPAIDAAFAKPVDPNHVRIVIFLTDGFVGNDQQILADVARVVGDARIYTVGIGSSVNHHLLDRMAEVGRGAYVFVRPDDKADDALDAFRSWVTLPYLTDLSIDWGALPITDVSPKTIRDLGAGQTLDVVGRYTQAADGNVVVRGKLGGRYWEQKIRVVLPERETGHGAIASVWARGRIEELLRNGGQPDAVKEQVVELALTHRLMSPFTSFVAVDDSSVVNPAGSPRVVHQALPIPEGSFGEKKDHLETVVVVGEKTTVDLPVAGRFYQNVLALSPGVQDPDGDGNPNVSGARERGFKTQVSGISSHDPLTGQFLNLVDSDSIEDLTVITAGAGAEFGRAQGGFAKIIQKEGSSARDLAFDVLADLAEHGTLTPTVGKNALADLLASQDSTGSLDEDVATHAIATWALAEAAARDPQNQVLAHARTSAINYLASLALKDGWPAEPGGPVDAEATRWARLVLSSLKPNAVRNIAEPKGEPSPEFTQLRASLAASKKGGTAPSIAGTSSFARLLRAIGRRQLKIVG